MIAPVAGACLLLLSLLLAIAALRQQRRDRRELAAVQLGMRRVAAAMLESARAEAQLATLRQLQRTAEQGVELGASAVRNIHMGIASIPFGILEAIPVTRHPTRIVRSLHDQISGVVYDSISGGNRLLGSALRLGLKAPAAGSGETPPAADTIAPKDHDA